MSRVKQVEEFHRVNELTEYAASEWKAAGLAAQLLIRRSHVFEVTTLDDQLIILVGVSGGSMIGQKPELWVLLGKEFEAHPRKYLRTIRGLSEHLKTVFPRLQSSVRYLDPQTKFAKFFGFREVWRDNDYIYYGVE